MKRLEIQGFKSFAKKTVIKFEEGITAVVGPNGSGKSNISDAIKWVLGEQSAKTLRGDKMEDVIFSGTENKNPQEFAEVVLVLDNKAQIFSNKEEEIKVNRKVFRSGDSEYNINGKSVRLKDIRELFMDTGIGKDGYSIISQGKIDEILSSKSEDRRNIFEEAAGIVKYKTRKLESEKKLEKTRENLVRIEDIIKEIEGQILPLESQSQKAEKYIELSEKLKKYEIELLSRDLKRIKEDKKREELELESSNDQIKELDEKLKLLKEKIYKFKIDKTENEEKYSSISQKRYSIITEIEKTKGNINLNSEIIQINNQKEIDKKNAVKRLNIQLEKIKEIQEDLIKNNKENEEIIKKQSLELENNKIYIEKMQEKKYKRVQDIEELKNKSIKNLNKISDFKISKSSIETNYKNYERREKDIASIMRNLEEKDKMFEAELENVKLKYNEISKQFDQIENNKKHTEKEIINSKNILNNLKIEIDKYKIQYEKDKSNLKILKDMKEDYEGYYKSVKSFLKYIDNTEIKSGICGVIAELLKTDKIYEKSIEIALGGYIQNIVTENTDYAKRSIEILKKNKLGRITFLPIDNIKARYLSDKESLVLKENGIIGKASDLIEIEPKYKNIFENILGRVIIVDNMDNMVKASAKYQNSFKMVTLEGDVMNPGGSMTGGNFKGDSLSLLSRTRKIEDLKIQIANMKNSYDIKCKEYSELERRVINLEKTMFSMETEINKVIIEKNNTKNILNSIDNNKENISREKNEYKKEIEAIEYEKNQIAIDKKEIDKKIDEISKENECIYENLQNKEKEIKIEDEKINELNSLLLKMEIEYASSMEKYKNSKDKLIDIKKEIAEKTNDIEVINKEIEKNYIEIKVISKKLQEEKERLLLLEKDIIKNDNQINELNIKKEEINKILERQEALEIKNENKRREVQEKINGLKINLEKINLNINSIRSRLWEEYEMSIMLAENIEKTNLERSVLKREVDNLKKQIREIGNVNIESIEELKQIKERFIFLSNQKNDLVEGEKSLKLVIREMNTKMKEQFIKRFEEIREQFKIVFKELFGGGKADIIIENTEDILNSGIEVIAEPPGKKLQNLTLLSGGEKALTAISILFAILKTKPTPFCILDEIEAALDEANVYRYAEYLKCFSEESQFIVITHRKGTMEAADTIYGVTMQDSGISSLLSVNLGEYE